MKELLYSIFMFWVTLFWFWSPDVDNSISKVEKIELKAAENIVDWKLFEEESEKDHSIIKEPVEKEIPHVNIHEKLASLYYNAYSATNKNKKEILDKLISNTEVNSVTIDIKTVSWYTSFALSDDYFSEIKPSSNDTILDIKALIEKLHEKDVYVIWRVVVFKDKLLSENRPDLAIKWSNNKSEVWTDYKWNKYLDPYSKEVWDYNINIASAAYELWFDEINFDYVRFPTDWYISKTSYPFSNALIYEDPKWWKMKVIDEFSWYITSELKKRHPDLVLSADVFWLITNVDLFQIWQNLESFLLHFDYVLPMIYPSHYSAGYLWAQIPDDIWYEIFKDSLTKAISRVDDLNENIVKSTNSWTTLKIKDIFEPNVDLETLWEISKNKIRPWLQWFTCTRCKWAQPYNRTKFREQIRAINDVWLNSRIVWNSASNYYSEWYWE